MTTLRDLPEAKQLQIRRAFASAAERVGRYEKALLAFLVESFPSNPPPRLSDALAREYVKRVGEYSKTEHAEAERMLDEALAAPTKLTATPEAPYATPS